MTLKKKKSTENTKKKNITTLYNKLRSYSQDLFRISFLGFFSYDEKISKKLIQEITLILTVLYIFNFYNNIKLKIQNKNEKQSYHK